MTTGNGIKTLITASALALGLSSAAFAQGATERPLDEERFDVAFGVSGTSNYMFRGITQTLNRPAIQGYVEASYDWVYAGVFASNVDFGGGDPRAEIDLYAGIRPEFGMFAFDFGVIRYIYPRASAADFTELLASVEFTPIEPLTLGAAVYYSPDLGKKDATYIEANASYALPFDFELSGALGRQYFNRSLGATDYTTWNVGLSYTFSDTVTLDARYHDNDLSGKNAKFTVSLSVDTSYNTVRRAMAGM